MVGVMWDWRRCSVAVPIVVRSDWAYVRSCLARGVAHTLGSFLSDDSMIPASISVAVSSKASQL